MAIHIEEFHIYQYRGIKDLYLKNLTDINILTGDNNSGKTSVLELMSTLEGPLSFDAWDGCTRKSVRSTLRKAYYESFLSLFPADSEKMIHYNATMKNGEMFDNYLKADFYESYISEEEMDHINAVTGSGKSKDQQQDKRVASMELTASSNRNERKLTEIFDFQYRVPRQSKKMERNQGLKCKLIEPFAHTNSRLSLSQVLSDYEMKSQIIEALREFDMDIIDIIDARQQDMYITPDYRIITRTSKTGLPLSAYGDGMKKAVMLMTEVLYARNGVILLDEFETAIHTSAMERVFSWILNVGLKNDVQFFMTSHSKEAIDVVLHSAPEIQEKINLYTLYKYEGKSLVRGMNCAEALNARENLGLDLR